MLSWLQNNIGTVIVSLILAAAVAAVIVKLIRDKRRGRTSCGCGCDRCPSANGCRKNK